MSKYIDADKLIQHLEDEIKGCEPPFGGRANGKSIAYGTALGLKSAISFANTLPTADVVEVVRCKDCEYYIALGRGYPYCSIFSNKEEGEYFSPYDDHFCSHGERKRWEK